MNTEVAKLEDELADAKQELAETITELDATKKEVDAMIEYFDRLKADCTAKYEEWTLRSSQRLEEIEGIKKALEILTSDEAKELFAKAIKPGMETFLQVDSQVVPADKVKQAGLDKLYGKLKDKATKSHSIRLAALASQVKMAKAGHFDEVIKSIDDLIKVLGEEQENDDKIKEHCETKRQDIAKKMAKIEWKIKNNEAKIE